MAVCERPTFLEQIVNLLPGPYVVKCVLFASILGVPLLLLTRFVDTLDVQATLAIFNPLSWQSVVTFSFANFILIFYAVYGVKYMRSKLYIMMPEIKSILPENSKKIQEIFKPTCNLTSAGILSLLLAAVSLASFPDQFSQHSAGSISLAQVALSFPFMYLAYGTFIWFYSSSVKCLHDLGKQPLKLADYYEDTYLGAKPIGSLSLSLALVYFSGLGLVFFSFLSIPALLELALVVMILGGIVLFFLPLHTIHKKMQQKKQLERDKLKNLHILQKESVYESMQNIQKTPTRDLKHMLEVDIVDRHVKSIPEWPFDFRTLTWLSAIVLAVIASIIAKYVTILLIMTR